MRRDPIIPVLVLPWAAWAAEGAPAQQTPPPQIQPPAAVAELPARAEQPEAALQGSVAYWLLQEIETLKAEVSRLRGQNEMLEYQLQSLAKRQSDLYLDLDRRLEALRKDVKGGRVSASAADKPPATVTAAKEDPLAESKAYESALDQFRAGNYDQAIAGFAEFLKTYPNSTLAANAHYWTGYAYYAKKDYKNALAIQTKLVSMYPQSHKVPDALLNIASSQLELNDTAAAKKNFQEIIAKYPGTNAAAIAAKRLELLK